MARFKNEAKAAGRLQHPNIVSVYEYGEDDKVTFIAMEYVEGAGLREYLNRRTSFDFGQLAALMEQLLDALEFAHERGVVHRDIKPSNLIITNAGQLKVADFGIARVDTSNLTMVGMTIGTPPYMSPEQIRGFEVDHRSDLFSTGIVLYELLTGERPFGGNLESVTYKICHDDPDPPSTRSALKLPVEVDHLVAKALAKEPDARFQDARTFHDALSEVARMSVQVDNGAGTTVVNIGTLMLGRPAPAWDEETLRTAEHELARVLGPMAKLIVRKAAAQTSDRVELCSLLADNIVDLDKRRKFVDAFNQTGSGVQRGIGATGGRSAATTGGGGTHPSGGSRPTTGSRPGTSQAAATQLATAPLDQTFIDQVTARLAVYIGPIAPILAKRAARDAKSRSDFLHRVAENLGTQERAAFLREVGLGGD
jgi:serine/threonine-protein kinase